MNASAIRLEKDAHTAHRVCQTPGRIVQRTPSTEDGAEFDLQILEHVSQHSNTDG